MVKTSFRLKSYWNYLRNKRSIQYIHSPFLFELMKFVFDDSFKYRLAEFDQIEMVRKGNLANTTVIEFDDLGAGGDVQRIKNLTVSSLAGRSVKQGKYARFLYRLGYHQKSQTVVELGTSLGITTAYFSLIPDVVVHTVEGDARIQAVAAKNWDTLGFRNIHSYLGDLNESSDIIYQGVGKIDFLFIDANHRLEAMIRYYLQALPFLHDRSVVVFDDIHWNPETLKAWNVIKSRSEITLSFDIFQMGVAFFNPDLSKEDFTLSY